MQLGSSLGSDHDADVVAALSSAKAALRDQDPQAMVQSVVDVVALLAPPRQKAALLGSHQAMSDDARLRLQRARQHALRRILLQLLVGDVARHGGLDLSDPGTWKLVSTPLTRLHLLLQGNDVNNLAGSKQWNLLVTVLRDGQALHKNDFDLTEFKCQRSSQRRDSVCDQSKAQVAETRSGKWRRGAKIYSPPESIKALDCVSRSPDASYTLKCSMCGHTVTSSWLWKHPKTGKLHILKPQHGHSGCALKKSGKDSHYQSVCGAPCKKDDIAGTTFCVHKITAKNCRHCNPALFCSHDRMKRYCRTCRRSSDA